MVQQISGTPNGSLVHRFISSGKPGPCELCGSSVAKLEAHHLCYSPEITINLCHLCHHTTHFFPNRLSKLKLHKLLLKKIGSMGADKIIQGPKLSISELAFLIAPSRSEHIRTAQKLEEIQLSREHPKI
jgi:hypothetical protein